MTCRRFVLFVAVVLAVVFSACVPPRPAPPPAGFPHAKHLTRPECAQTGQANCFSCETCHQDVSKANRPSRPSATTCRKCHPQGDQLLERVAPKERPEELLGRTIRFTHQDHLKRPEIKGQCMRCHSGIKDPDASDFAAMKTCMTCHQKDFDAARCTLCHEQTSLSQIIPTKFLSHDSNWIRGHGMAAARSGKMCARCHEQQYCLGCHDQNQPLRVELRRPDAIERELVHRGDWLSRHPIEAKSQPTTCQRCHSVSSCSSCHARRGVAAIGKGSVNPHPRGWVGPENLHGPAAKYDILTCAGCHDQGPATNCIHCHRPGGGAGNPHPNGWKSARSPTASMCRYCHDS